MIIKKAIVKFLKALFCAINSIIPKKSNLILFKSRPDFSGNARAFYEFIIINHPEFDPVWVIENQSTRPDLKTVKPKSVKWFFCFIRSRYIVTTHNEMIGVKGNNQVYISLWHGMPLKKICYLGDYDYKGMEDYSAYRIASSEIMRSIISASFREKANNVYITGQPRNDYLFEGDKANSLLSGRQENKRIILYMPTFRENQEAERYSDGKKIEKDNFFRVTDFSLNELNCFLKENNYHLVIKLHPYEEKSLIDINLGENITLITTATLREHDVDVNHLMAKADILISDYSSAYFDFMILNRPICFLIPDLNAYSESRSGFTLEPVESWMPGAKIHTQKELLIELEELAQGNDKFSGKRNEISEMINKHKDNKNSERVFRQFIS